LENNLVTGAFTPDRIEILNILATQAAISIENAKYYKQINDLNIAYERFVPQSFLNQLDRKSIIDIRLGDQSSKTMSVMFADIRGFTSLSERKSPDEIFTLLNEIWGIINPIIDSHGGIIDKYIGDAIMALFPTSPAQALRAAVEIQHAILEFNAARASTGDFIRMGMGVNHGTMILGTVGSEARLNTTVIGDTVNVAARLETLSKQLGAKVLLTSGMRDEIEEPFSFTFRNLGSHILPGKSQEMTILEEFSAIEGPLKEQIIAHLPLFNTFIDAFDRGDMQEASRHLTAYLLQVPDDHIAEFYKQKFR
jgi:class 3 adenylate cyclase